MAKLQIPRSPKLDFFYFLVFTIIVLLIFSYIIFRGYFNYWYRIYIMEQYYKGQSQQ